MRVRAPKQYISICQLETRLYLYRERRRGGRVCTYTSVSRRRVVYSFCPVRVSQFRLEDYVLSQVVKSQQI